MDYLPAQGINKGIIFLRISDNDVVLCDKESVGNLLFAEKDFPEPGVPRIRPFGFFSFFRSTMIMLLESAFSP